MDETKAVARLPGLDIEISRRDPGDGSETVTIAMRATPSFAAFGAALEPALLMMPALLPALMLQGWAAMAQLAWAPWLGPLPGPRAAERSRGPAR